MIYNFAASVKELKTSSMVNSWKELLTNHDDEPDTAGSETVHFHNALLIGGESAVSMNDIDLWLEEEDQDPGYYILTEEIIENVTGAEYFDEDDGIDDTINPNQKLSKVRDN